MRLLLCEDEKRMAQALCELLKQERYEVDHFSNGLDGLSALESGIYDIAILDVMLPGLSGYEIAKRARKKGVTLPILMLTAKSEHGEPPTGDFPQGGAQGGFSPGANPPSDIPNGKSLASSAGWNITLTQNIADSGEGISGEGLRGEADFSPPFREESGDLQSRPGRDSAGFMTEQGASGGSQSEGANILILIVSLVTLAAGLAVAMLYKRY